MPFLDGPHKNVKLTVYCILLIFFGVRLDLGYDLK